MYWRTDFELLTHSDRFGLNPSSNGLCIGGLQAEIDARKKAES